MIKKLTKVFSVLIIGIICFVFCTPTVLALNKIEYPQHNLSLSLPDDYTLLDAETASENKDIIESLGYTVSSFKNYLKPNSKEEYSVLFLGVNQKTNSQISLRTDKTEFSEKIGDLSYLSDEALSKTANELIKTENTSYKTAFLGGMKLIEMRTSDKDSGGEFSSIQYLTVRNGRIYSLGFSFDGEMNEQQVNFAWDTVKELEIKDVLTKSAWDLETIILMILLCAVILGALVAGGIIIFTIVRDLKNRNSDSEPSPEYIRRRGKKPRWK